MVRPKRSTAASGTPAACTPAALVEEGQREVAQVDQLDVQIVAAREAVDVQAAARSEKRSSRVLPTMTWISTTGTTS